MLTRAFRTDLSKKKAGFTMYSLNRGLLEYLFTGKVGESILDGKFYLPIFIVSLAIIVGASYMLGSVNSAIIVSRIFYKDDIRKHGSGNAGMTNMLRTYGGGAALMTLIGDMMKTFIAIFLAATVFGFQYIGGVSTGDGICYIAGMCVVFGHIFPCFYNFKGGKGVLATATMALILSPVVFLILLLLFVLIVATSKYVSLGSVTVAVLYPIVLSGYFKFVFSKTDLSVPGFAALASITLAILIVWCHRKNLERISNRTENKLSFGKKKNDDE